MVADSTTALGQRLRKAERRGHFWAYVLIAPLFLFVALSFIVPLGTVLLNSVYDPIIPDNLSRTVRALTTTSKPASASASAPARPIPRLAPVTMATGELPMTDSPVHPRMGLLNLPDRSCWSFPALFR